MAELTQTQRRNPALKLAGLTVAAALLVGVVGTGVQVVARNEATAKAAYEAKFTEYGRAWERDVSSPTRRRLRLAPRQGRPQGSQGMGDPLPRDVPELLTNPGGVGPTHGSLPRVGLSFARAKPSSCRRPSPWCRRT